MVFCLTGRFLRKNWNKGYTLKSTAIKNEKQNKCEYSSKYRELSYPR